MSVERFVGLVSVLTLVGCGPIAGGDYFGEVLFEIEGMVLPDAEVQFDGDVGVALLWANQEELDRSAQAVVVETRFPARYKLKIYAPPNADSELDVSGERVLTASVAQILLFEDRDSNGVWDRDVEARIGGAYNTALLFVPDDGLPYANLGSEPAFVGDPAAMPPEPFSPPIWAPVPGFTVVDVAPGPFCERPWETWMEPKDAKAATLYVGFFRLDNDWDCDGVGNDFLGPDGPQPVPDDALFDDECPPLDIMEQECEILGFELENALALPVADPSTTDWLQGWLLDLEQCYALVCPELLQQVNDLVAP